MSAELKRTPLYEEHLRLKARMVEFGGWSMPVQYSSLLEEHQAVRKNVGIFDISHMGQFLVDGAAAEAWLDQQLTNRVANLAPGECHYTFLLNEQGGVIDDLIVYRLGPERFFLVVNAARLDEDFRWLQERLPGGVSLVNRSAESIGIAVQGPNAPTLFARLFPDASYPVRNRVLELGSCFVATTGYTGEEGFEIFGPASEGSALWQSLLEKGSDLGIRPCGLGCRDTLRLEMCYPLNGSDLHRDRTPLEAGLGFFVDLTKPEFTGIARLQAQKASGVPSKLVALKVTEKSPPVRAHYPVFANGEPIGELTSGTFSPSLEIGIAMAYLPPELAKVGSLVEIDVRGRRYPARIEKKPLYRRPDSGV